MITNLLTEDFPLIQHHYIVYYIYATLKNIQKIRYIHILRN